MPVGSDEARWEAELRAVRDELAQLRAEQKEMAESIRQLVQTFRSLATHLGIASEPYVRKSRSSESERELPGFG